MHDVNGTSWDGVWRTSCGWWEVVLGREWIAM